APAQGNVTLAGLAVVELAGELPVAVRVPCDDQNAGGFPVQAVHYAGFGVAIVLQAGDQAVLVVLGTTGHRQQQGGFINDQKGGILVEDTDIGQGHRGSTVPPGDGTCLSAIGEGDVQFEDGAIVLIIQGYMHLI